LNITIKKLLKPMQQLWEKFKDDGEAIAMNDLRIMWQNHNG
jgi:hypothetical protein